jgi:hypothetical protein
MPKTIAIIGLGLIGSSPTQRYALCGDPLDFICSGQLNCPGIKDLSRGQILVRASRRETGPAAGRKSKGR